MKLNLSQPRATRPTLTRGRPSTELPQHARRRQPVARRASDRYRLGSPLGSRCAVAAALAVGAMGQGCSKHETAGAGSATSSAAGQGDAPKNAPGGGVPGGASAGGGSSAGATRTYTLYWTTQKEPAGGVKVSIEVPAAWQETLDAMGGPSFRNNGLSYGPDLVLVPASGADAKARIEALVLRQYDAAALSTAVREDAADGGTVWIAATRPDGYVDARRFLATPGDGGVVVCVITLKPEEAARLPELKKICATARLAP